MLILANTTDTLIVIPSSFTSTANLEVVASYVDRSTSTGVVGVADRQLTKIDTVTETTIVNAPTSGNVRSIQSLCITNANAYQSVEVTLKYSTSANTYMLYRPLLLVGESLVYTEDEGFKVAENTITNDRFSTITTNSVQTAANTLGDTGLGMPVSPNTIVGFLGAITHTTAATTTGARFAIGASPAPTFIRVGMIDTVTVSATAAALSTGTSDSSNGMLGLQTTGVGLAAGLGLIAGTIISGTSPTYVIVQSATEVAASAATTVFGSWFNIFHPTG